MSWSHYDTEESWAEEYREAAPTPKRVALIREAWERSEVNHAAEASRRLRRAAEVVTPTYRSIHSLDKLKAAARGHIAAARAVRTLIGPPCPLSRIPF